MKFIFNPALLLACALALPALATAQPVGASAAMPGDLYQTFGELPGLQRLAKDLVSRASTDPRIQTFFAKTDKDALATSLGSQFCSLLGGPCEYTGPDMKLAHKDLGLSTAHFNALVEDLQQAMDAQGIPFRAQNRLLALLAPMYRDVNERP